MKNTPLVTTKKANLHHLDSNIPLKKTRRQAYIPVVIENSTEIISTKIPVTVIPKVKNISPMIPNNRTLLTTVGICRKKQQVKTFGPRTKRKITISRAMAEVVVNAYETNDDKDVVVAIKVEGGQYCASVTPRRPPRKPRGSN